MIEHAQHAWGNFLKTVKAARGVNVLQTGQPLADELVPTVQVEQLGHLAEPTRWTQSGLRAEIAAVAGQFSRVEIRAVRPFWLTWIQQANVDVQVATIPAHLLGTADIIPASVFGEAPNIRYRAAAAVAGVVADALLAAPGLANPFPFPERGLFVPLGLILEVARATVNTDRDVSLLMVEVPDPTTAP